MTRLALEVCANPWIPHNPTGKQAVFSLLWDAPEIMYGGAAGGGKSDAILMEALRYADNPEYRGLILRRNFPQLSQSGGLLERADEWLRGSGARWKEKRKSWIFPSGAVLTFGHMENEKDKYRYQGGEYNFVAFDELTQFTESQYRYLFSRTRRLVESNIPVRMRSASNPGGVGHEWVYRRFVNNSTREPGAHFVPARLDDNPHIDQVDYRGKLAKLDAVTRAQLERGDWLARVAGTLLRRDMFDIVPSAPLGVAERVRAWDLAGTEPKYKASGDTTDPDYSAGAKVARLHDGRYLIEHIDRFRHGPSDTEKRVAQMAKEDGTDIRVGIEQEPGASGKSLIDMYDRLIIPSHMVEGRMPTGPKLTRTKVWAGLADQGAVMLVAGPWNHPFLDEAEAFDGSGDGGHDDMIDAVSHAFGMLLENVGAEGFAGVG